MSRASYRRIRRLVRNGKYSSGKAKHCNAPNTVPTANASRIRCFQNQNHATINGRHTFPTPTVPSDPPPGMDNNDRLKFVTTIHITALDGIVNVNSLFTLAVFIGLAWNPNDPSNRLVDDPNCAAGPKIAEDLICFHVYSFGCFLFSSLVALGLKQAIRIAKNSCDAPIHHRFLTFDLCHINKTALRVGYLVSAAGSVFGCGFLMMALVNVAQIKLGTLGCGSSHTYGAIVPLVILVPTALFIYVSFVVYAFTR